MKQLEVIGKNIESAISQGLLELGLTREEVDIKIIDAGGMFKKAKVVLEYEGKEDTEVVAECNCDDKCDCGCQDGKECTCDNCICSEDACDCLDDECDCNCDECHCDDENKFVENDETHSINTFEKKLVKKPRVFKPVVKNPELETKLQEFMNGLMFAMKVRGTVTFEYTEDALVCAVNGDNVGKLIGFRGESLNSIQQILNSISRNTPERTRVLFDVENYRKKRESTLIALGKRMANKAQVTHKDVHLEPMTPYERMIIHTSLQDVKGITTDSTGEGDRRHIVIKVLK